jgi:hypothetical protein
MAEKKPLKLHLSKTARAQLEGMDDEDRDAILAAMEEIAKGLASGKTPEELGCEKIDPTKLYEEEGIDLKAAFANEEDHQA